MAQSTGGAGRVMKGSVVVILSLVIFAIIDPLGAAVIQGDGCKFSIDYSSGDLKEPQPLILTREKTGVDFLYPRDRSCDLRLTTNEKLLIACPGKGNSIQGISGLGNLKEIEASCIDGKTFEAEYQRFEITSVACKFLAKHEARNTRTRCHRNATSVEIGFKLQESFLRTVDVCWDDKTMTTHSSKFTLTRSIGCFQSPYPRPGWQSGDFYGSHDIDLQYKVKTQLKTLTKLIGSEELAGKYIDSSHKRFMARGHLTAKADFVYGAAQSTTFWYLNAAPQWQSFNAGNWNTLEGNVRRFAGTRSSDIEVYTGVHGQMSLPDVNDNLVPIYLYADGHKRAFPVPKFYWKVIYDRATKRGTAFVGSNDPWAEKSTGDMFICEDISEKVKWLTWQPDDIVKGVSYACRVDDLRKVVPSVPSLKVNGILV